MKTTKKTCEAFAAAHNLTIEMWWNTSFFDRGWEYEISIPDGYIMQDGTTGRTECCGEVPKAEAWVQLMEHMQECTAHDWQLDD
jgi:hypothetical protein